MVERETLVEAGIATVGVGLFIATVFAAGLLYGESGTGTLSRTGGYLLVGAMVLFVVGMAAVGYYLASR